MSIIEIELRGFDELERSLRGFAATLIDLRPFWPLVVPMFVRWMGDQFSSEGGWGGHTWTPLSAEYAAEKAARYPGRSILIATGALRGAASRPQRTATPSSLTLTITDPKVGYHQDGTPTMPARPVIPNGLPASADAELEEAAERYCAEMAARFGLT